MRKAVSVLAALAVAAGLGAAAVPALSAGNTVSVSDDYFAAKTITVSRGSTVTWRWVGDDGHNVVGKGFRSKVKSSGTFKHRFAKRGTFRYTCTLHADDGMAGKVIVR
jgi:plastocyanin